MVEEVPDCNTSRYRDVERVLGATLRNFEAYVALVDNVLVHAVYFMAENEGVASAGLWREVLKLDAAFDLFETAEGVAVVLEGGYAFGCGGIVAPFDRVFGSEGCLVDFRRWRARADTTQGNSLDSKGIASAEYGSYVVEASHIVEHDCQMHLALSAVVLDVYAVKVPDCFFLHEGVVWSIRQK